MLAHDGVINDMLACALDLVDLHEMNKSAYPRSLFPLSCDCYFYTFFSFDDRLSCSQTATGKKQPETIAQAVVNMKQVVQAFGLECGRPAT
jgi:hypothetical protein